MNANFDYPSIINRVLLDDDLLERAQAKWRACSADVLSRNHERTAGTLRTSDAGGCVLEKWADIHDELDLPEDPHALLSKMNMGSLSGAWIACLLAAGVEAAGPQWRVDVEVEVEYEGISGHIDAVIYRENDPRLAAHEWVPLETVECKMTMWGGTIDGPKPAHVVQSGRYALAVEAPTHVVLVHAPAVQRRKGVLPPNMAQYRFDTHDTAQQVVDEYERLAIALDMMPPEGDAAEDWQCRSCRYSACDRNRNPLAAQEVLA